MDGVIVSAIQREHKSAARTRSAQPEPSATFGFGTSVYDRLEGLNHPSPDRSELLAVQRGKLGQERAALGCQPKQHLPAIQRRALALGPTVLFELIDQRDGGVVLHTQPIRQRADRRLDSLGQASNSEQRLMLLRLDTGPARGTFTEGQKFADFVAKLRQGAIIRQVDLRHAEFPYPVRIVSSTRA
jgi:hypothetical protein